MTLTTDLLTTNEVAELLHVPVATLRWWRHKGTGPMSFNLGARKVMYRRSDVTEWLQAQYAAAGLRNPQDDLDAMLRPIPTAGASS